MRWKAIEAVDRSADDNLNWRREIERSGYVVEAESIGVASSY